MRILWLCNICPPAVAAALGQSYSVREGWLTGALNPVFGRRRGACAACRLLSGGGRACLAAEENTAEGV